VVAALVYGFAGLAFNGGVRPLLLNNPLLTNQAKPTAEHSLMVALA